MADKADGALPLTVFIFTPTEYVNSLGEPTMYADRFKTPHDPINDPVAHAVTVTRGMFDLLTRVYFLVDDPKHIIHETGHVVWTYARPTESCPNDPTQKVSSWVGHGGPCDPLLNKRES